MQSRKIAEVANFQGFLGNRENRFTLVFGEAITIVRTWPAWGRSRKPRRKTATRPWNTGQLPITIWGGLGSCRGETRRTRLHRQRLKRTRASVNTPVEISSGQVTEVTCQRKCGEPATNEEQLELLCLIGPLRRANSLRDNDQTVSPDVSPTPSFVDQSRRSNSFL
jgi:hypothetical protein